MTVLQELLKEADDISHEKNRIRMQLDLLDTRQDRWIEQIKYEMKKRGD